MDANGIDDIEESVRILVQEWPHRDWVHDGAKAEAFEKALRAHGVSFTMEHDYTYGFEATFTLNKAPVSPHRIPINAPPKDPAVERQISNYAKQKAHERYVKRRKEGKTH